MTAQRSGVAVAVAGALAFALALGAGGSRADTEADASVTRTVAGVPHERGAWRSRSQSAYDARAQTLVRRTFTVFDPLPALGRDFVWLPDTEGDARAERITGTGRLIWRDAGKPSYDPASFHAEYRGRMRNGRPEGEGAYRDRTGLSYDGTWRAGRSSGAGTLRLGNGAEYAGRFEAGAAHGTGRFFDVDGEVFEGTFRHGLRHGPGRTMLPGGGAYRSEWVAGEEVPNSRKLRLAQLGPAAGAAEEVRLGVTVDRVDDPALLQYASSNAEGELVIQPSRKRLMAAWKGDDEIQLTGKEEDVSERGSYGIFAYSAGDLPPLTLVFEVQNRGAAPLGIKGAYLDVDVSATDLQPAVQLTAGSSGECSARARPDFSPRFELENFGWGPAERAKLRFAFAAPKAAIAPSAFAVTKEIGTIKAVSKVDLEPELRAAGVRVDMLKQRSTSGGGIACRSKGNPNACLSEIVATGLFGTLGRMIRLEEREIFLNATGVLDYAWRNQRGEEASRTSPFSTRILLGRTPVEAECGEGAEKEPVGKKPLEFRLDQTRYRLPVAFSRTVRAGGTARYTVAVKAPKSSEHKFKVVLQTADGRQVTSRPITLTYFLPSRLTDQYLNQ